MSLSSSAVPCHRSSQTPRSTPGLDLHCLLDHQRGGVFEVASTSTYRLKEYLVTSPATLLLKTPRLLVRWTHPGHLLQRGLAYHLYGVEALAAVAVIEGSSQVGGVFPRCKRWIAPSEALSVLAAPGSSWSSDVRLPLKWDFPPSEGIGGSGDDSLAP